MKKTYFILSLFLLLGGLMKAQEVAISYEIVPQTDNSSIIQLYMQSLTAEDQPIRAINFSLAMPAGCATITGQAAVFSDSWTDFLQEVQLTEKLDLTYNNWHYSQRWQYGSADPGLPNTTPVIAPAKGEDRLPIMQIMVEGSCADKLYLEQHVENPLNQMGDGDVQPIDWTVVHPKTELELEEGLLMKVFPNPVVDKLLVKFEGARDQAYSFSLYTLDGKYLMGTQLGMNEAEEVQMDMTQLPAAMYLLQISSPETEGARPLQLKIIKK